MELSRATIIVVCVAIYFVICILVGIWALRRTRSAQDFFMAGRNLGVLVTAVAVFSSVMSGFGFVGGPGLVYHSGASSFWIVVSAGLGNCVCVFLLGRKLREFSERHESISLPDVVMEHYRSRVVSALAAVAILLGVFGYLATQIAAMAKVLQNLVAGPLGESWAQLEYCAWFSTGLLVFYCVTGGIIASVYTDVFQGLIMMVAAVLVFLTAVASVEGGITGMSHTIMADDPASIGPWGTRGMFGCLSWYFVFAFGVSGQPHVITKLMMTRRPSDIRMILPMTVIGYSLTALLWVGIGMAMRSLVLQGEIDPLASQYDAAPAFLNRFAHPWLAGIVFAGLFAAIMSTADAFLNIGAAAVVHDLPKAIFGKTPKHELAWARLTTVGIAVIAAWVAIDSQALVDILGIFGWGTFAAALAPVVAIGLHWKQASARAAAVAILASLIVNFSIAYRTTEFWGAPWLASWLKVPLQLDGGFVALLVSLTLFVSISLYDAKRDEKQ